jgi:Transposase DDE domain group 1
VQQDKTDQTTTSSKTECKGQALLFPELIGRSVRVDFAGGYVSSDGGALLLGRLDRSYGYLQRFSQHFVDYRNQELIEHSVLELLRQRIYGIALGYEDLNDHDQLRQDPLLAAVCGKSDVLGQRRHKRQDEGKGLAGKSTLNRMELTGADASRAERYKKILALEEAIADYFIQEWVRSLPGATEQVILDLDATNDPLHGQQEGRFFQGLYQEYCYLPLYIFCGHWPIVAKLRSSQSQASAGALEEVQKIFIALRKKFPRVRIILRADSGFCRSAIMEWCEQKKVSYVFGLARNKVLQRRIKSAMRQAKALAQQRPEQSARVFVEFDYAAGSWSKQKRRVIAKAQWTEGEPNPRFIITNLALSQYRPTALYEELYCARGEMENRIKEQQLDLFAERTSTHWMRSNQLRLWFSTLAYLLLNQMRTVALMGTELAHACCGTIRLRLLKIGAVIKVSFRRVCVSLSSAFPLTKLFRQLCARLAILPPAAG